MSNPLTHPIPENRTAQEELAALIESGQGFANQVRAVTYKLNGQAYSSTVSALNQFDADLRRTRAVLAAESLPPPSQVGGSELLTTIKEFAHWHHLNEVTIAAGKTPSDSEIDFEATAWSRITRAVATAPENSDNGH